MIYSQVAKIKQLSAGNLAVLASGSEKEITKMIYSQAAKIKQLSAGNLAVLSLYQPYHVVLGLHSAGRVFQDQRMCQTYTDGQSH